MIKDSPANARDSRDVGSIPGSGRSPGVGNGTPLQYSFLENSMDRGAWGATVHGMAESQTRLSDSAHTRSAYAVASVTSFMEDNVSTDRGRGLVSRCFGPR